MDGSDSSQVWRNTKVDERGQYAKRSAAIPDVSQGTSVQAQGDLPGNIRVHGVVVLCGSDMPLEGAIVRLRGKTTVTDVAGRFVFWPNIERETPELRAFIEHPDYCYREVGASLAVWEDGLVVEMIAGASLYGTVSTPNGVAVVGATVIVEQAFAEVSVGGKQSRAGTGRIYVGGGGVQGAVRTDAHGHYLCRGLVPEAEGSLVSVEAEGYERQSAILRKLPGMDQSLRMDWVLQPLPGTAIVMGCVSVDGAPKGRAVVSWSASDNRSGRVFADEAGVYRVENLGVGQVQVCIDEWPGVHGEFLDKYVDGERCKGVVIGDQGLVASVNFDLEVQAATVMVRGAVVDRQGQVVGGGRVKAFLGGYEQWADVDEWGRFEFQAPLDSRGSLVSFREGYGIVRVDDVEAGDVVEIIMSRVAPVRCRLEDAQSGDPLGGGELVLLDGKGGYVAGEALDTFEGGWHTLEVPFGEGEAIYSWEAGGYPRTYARWNLGEGGSREWRFAVSRVRPVEFEVNAVSADVRCIVMEADYGLVGVERSDWQLPAWGELVLSNRILDGRGSCVVQGLADGVYDVIGIDCMAVPSRIVVAPEQRTFSLRVYSEGGR